MAFVKIECGTKGKNDRVVRHCVVRHCISWGCSEEGAGEGELG